jgi:hypothetical protein
MPPRPIPLATLGNPPAANAGGAPNPQSHGQPPLQSQMHPNAAIGNQGNQQTQGQQQCGCSPGHPCPQHAVTSPLVRCIKFLACWDCGPIGIIIGAVAFAAGTVLAYYALQVAIWTATKDYIEHCQSDVVCQVPKDQTSEA